MSIVEILVCTKCMKSEAKTTVPAAGTAFPPKSFFRNTYIIGSISTPKSVPLKRQPKGVIPNSAIPTEMISFPNGGWVIS